MAVLLNRKTLKAPLPDMPMTAVVPMIPPDLAGHPPLHERTEAFSGRGRHDEMKMIGHETEAEDLDGMLGFGHAEQLREGRIVGVFVKNRASAVATIQHVVGVSSAGAARNARHEARTIDGGEPGRQGKSSLVS